ncbi:MAG: hypothetical protein GY821_12545 [Gammaproteobacteria bacterium]|nr:hypothetical protein [Gammaproteobacteria bacterium]
MNKAQPLAEERESMENEETSDHKSNCQSDKAGGYKPTPRGIKIMEHALGLDRENFSYRNRFETIFGHDDYRNLKMLEKHHFVFENNNPYSEERGTYIFHVSVKGKKLFGL